jgi:hypothetical protein
MLRSWRDSEMDRRRRVSRFKATMLFIALGTSAKIGVVEKLATKEKAVGV